MTGKVEFAIVAGAAMTALLAAGAAGAGPVGFAWGYNSFGVPGLIDMPEALSRPDAEFATQVFHFKNQTRISTTFQVTPRLSATFRYALLYRIRPSPSSAIVPYRFDRSFSAQYRLFDETRWRPAVAIGLNDLVGSGIYAGEYVVGTKTLSPRLRGTLGMGWGRLGSHGSFRNPLGLLRSSFDTRTANSNGYGGNFDPKAWFHGPAALFGGIEWRASDRLRFIAEYSSDAYLRENGAAFRWHSPINVALAYNLSKSTTVTASYLYGSQVGLQLTHALNPRFPPNGSGIGAAPPPFVPRPAAGRAPAGPQTDLATLQDRTDRGLRAQGLRLDGLSRDGTTLRIEIRNIRYGSTAEAVGRAARILTRTAPADIDTFAITVSDHGMPVTTVTLPRDALTKLAYRAVAPDLLRAQTRIVDARHNLPALPGRYPAFDWSLQPYLLPSLFDPDNPVRADFGLSLGARVEPLPGLILSGHLHKKIIGNLNQSRRPSDSVLPHVRSDSALYYKTNGATIPDLTLAWYFRPGHNLFGRVTAGLLEPMFGGVSAEVLWKPQNSRLALGAEINRAVQRGYDQRFDFRDYRVTTGHLTAYYDLNRGYHAQLSVGRYLAGDTGATLEFDRQFDNGWRVGVFATKTNISAAQFGEGSFDKGIRLTIPIDWVTGRPSRTRLNTTIRPVTRDGGAILSVPGRLYETVRGRQASTLDATWGRFWR